jgi:hypothetical protein
MAKKAADTEKLTVSSENKKVANKATAKAVKKVAVKKAETTTPKKVVKKVPAKKATPTKTVVKKSAVKTAAVKKTIVKQLVSKRHPDELLVDAVVAGLQEKKGERIVILDLRQLENRVADYYIVCHYQKHKYRQ